jgi:hypothetical protein
MRVYADLVGFGTRQSSAREDQAGGRAMSKQATFVGTPDPAAAVQDDTFGLDQTCLRRDRTHKGNLELQSRLADPPLQCRLDSQSHAAIE